MLESHPLGSFCCSLFCRIHNIDTRLTYRPQFLNPDYVLGNNSDPCGTAVRRHFCGEFYQFEIAVLKGGLGGQCCLETPPSDDGDTSALQCLLCCLLFCRIHIIDTRLTSCILPQAKRPSVLASQHCRYYWQLEKIEIACYGRSKHIIS